MFQWLVVAVNAQFLHLKWLIGWFACDVFAMKFMWGHNLKHPQGNIPKCFISKKKQTHEKTWFQWLSGWFPPPFPPPFHPLRPWACKWVLSEFWPLYGSFYLGHVSTKCHMSTQRTNMRKRSNAGTRGMHGIKWPVQILSQHVWESNPVCNGRSFPVRGSGGQVKMMVAKVCFRFHLLYFWSKNNIRKGGISSRTHRNILKKHVEIATCASEFSAAVS